MTVAERYLRLGLRLGRHVEGLVDGYYGPPELQAGVDAEELRDPRSLAEDAQELLGELDSADLEPQRRRWLAGQLRGLECAALMTAGDEVPWREAVQRCYGLDVDVVPEERFEAIHARLDSVLPGSGDVAGRLERWHATQILPAGKLLPAFEVVSAELRRETERLVELPEGEELVAETVAGQPWAAYNWYQGGLRSRIEINTDLPVRSYYFAILAAHEGYPGHHTEHACKEARLVRGQGYVEASILLIHTPECLVSEGIALIAHEAALGEDWARRVAGLLRPLDIPVDAEVASAVLDAVRDFKFVDVNIGLGVSEQGWSVEEAVAYHRRWALSEEERARKSVEFDLHPLWGIYGPTYAYGYGLARDYARSREDGVARLLTEQLTTADLLEPAPV